MPRAANISDWGALFALTLMWGSSFALNEVALQSVTPSALVAVRVIIGAFVMFTFMRASGVRLPQTVRGWAPLAVMAVLGNVLPFQLVAWGQQYIDSSLAAILMAIIPLVVLTLARFFIPGTRLDATRVAGFVAGFAGVILIIGPDAMLGVQGNMALFGGLAILGAALSYAVNSVYARRLGARDPRQLAAGMLIVASLLSMPPAAVDLPALSMPGPGATAALLMLGLFSTGFATIFYFRIIQGPGPAFLSLVNYLVPAWAVLLGVVFLEESLTVSTNLGLALILSGTAISELRLSTLRHMAVPLLQPRFRRAATEEA